MKSVSGISSRGKSCLNIARSSSVILMQPKLLHQTNTSRTRPHPRSLCLLRRISPDRYIPFRGRGMTTRTRAPLPVMERGWGEVCMKGRGWGLKNFSSSSLIRRRTSSINLMRTIGQNILIFCLSVGDMKASMRGSGYGCKKTFLTM